LIHILCAIFQQNIYNNNGKISFNLCSCACKAKRGEINKIGENRNKSNGWWNETFIVSITNDCHHKNIARELRFMRRFFYYVSSSLRRCRLLCLLKNLITKHFMQFWVFQDFHVIQWHEINLSLSQSSNFLFQFPLEILFVNLNVNFFQIKFLFISHETSQLLLLFVIIYLDPINMTELSKRILPVV
jgi:hypothetical protein